ncbi:MAG: hypothetical protein WDM78_03765 [Puia sp.]
MTTIYHIPDKGKFFGSYGVSGGINIVNASGKHEWRALGIEVTIQNEFGNYSDFRKSLPDSAANVIFKKHLQPLWDFIPISFGKADTRWYSG